MKKLIATMTLPIVIGACACNGNDMTTVTAADLQHHNWELIQIDGQALTLSDKQKAPRLEIGENLQATGNAGCNNFFGQAQLKDNQFSIGAMGMTQKMCYGEVMDIEHTFSQVLDEWSTITLSKEYLELDNGTHKLTFRLNDFK